MRQYKRVHRALCGGDCSVTMMREKPAFSFHVVFVPARSKGRAMCITPFAIPLEAHKHKHLGDTTIREHTKCDRIEECLATGASAHAVILMDINRCF